MATENKPKRSNPNKADKKRKQYLPHNKPVKKGAYGLRPGVQGFFVTCDGGRERQASSEAINVIDSFYEEIVNGTEPKIVRAQSSEKPLNKITKFTYSDSSSNDDDENDEDANDGHHKDECTLQTKVEEANKPAIATDSSDENSENLINKESGHQKEDAISSKKQARENSSKTENRDDQVVEDVEPPVKKQCVETDATKCRNGLSNKVEKISVDKLIEAELAELGDRGKRRFSSLDSGCNGVVFVQMRKRDGDPGPKDIVQHMMSSLASTKKHVSRFLLRVLPIEITCYASDEEIKQAIKPVIDKFFPVETQKPLKFAVLYDARANTGIDRKRIIDAIAKSVPSSHKVDLSNPDVSIVVQIVKTICLIGIVEKYKELAKYNVRELTSSNA